MLQASLHILFYFDSCSVEDIDALTMWPTVELFLLESLSYCLLLKKQQMIKPHHKNKWNKKWLLRRSIHSHVDLIKDLREDLEDWRSYLRLMK